MKRQDVIRRLTDAGCEFVRHGGRHDIYRNPATGLPAPVPHHREISDSLVRLIERQLGVQPVPQSDAGGDDVPPA